MNTSFIERRLDISRYFEKEIRFNKRHVNVSFHQKLDSFEMLEGGNIKYSGYMRKQ